MKFITVAGPPSSGKTLVLVHLIKLLKKDNIKVAIGKIDCHQTTDGELFKEKLDIPVEELQESISSTINEKSSAYKEDKSVQNIQKSTISLKKEISISFVEPLLR